MSEIRELKMKLLASLDYFKGFTIQELKKKVEWMKNYSEFGISNILVLCEKDDLIFTRTRKDGEIIYFAKTKGVRLAEKYFNNN